MIDQSSSSSSVETFSIARFTVFEHRPFICRKSHPCTQGACLPSAPPRGCQWRPRGAFSSGMLSLSLCRSALARSAWTRGTGLLLAWMIAAAGLPRWEVHAHDDAVHGHAHSVALVEHDNPTQPLDNDDGLAVPHLHEVTTVSAGLPALLRLDVHSVSPGRWTRPIHSAPTPSAAGPPPHRPPIA